MAKRQRAKHKARRGDVKRNKHQAKKGTVIPAVDIDEVVETEEITEEANAPEVSTEEVAAGTKPVQEETPEEAVEVEEIPEKESEEPKEENEEPEETLEEEIEEPETSEEEVSETESEEEAEEVETEPEEETSEEETEKPEVEEETSTEEEPAEEPEMEESEEVEEESEEEPEEAEAEPEETLEEEIEEPEVEEENSEEEPEVEEATPEEEIEEPESEETKEDESETETPEAEEIESEETEEPEMEEVPVEEEESAELEEETEPEEVESEEENSEEEPKVEEPEEAEEETPAEEESDEVEAESEEETSEEQIEEPEAEEETPEEESDEIEESEAEETESEEPEEPEVEEVLVEEPEVEDVPVEADEKDEIEEPESEEAVEVEETPTEEPEVEEETPEAEPETEEPEAEAEEVEAEPEAEEPKPEEKSVKEKLTYAKVFADEIEEEKAKKAKEKAKAVQQEIPKDVQEAAEQLAENVPKKRKWPKVLLCLVIVIALLCGGVYAADRFLMNTDKFLSGTTINDIDVSGKTAAEAKKILADKANKSTLSIYQNGGIAGSIVGYTLQYDYGNKIEEKLHPEFLQRVKRFFVKSERSYHVAPTVTKTDKSFNRQFRNLTMVKNAKGSRKTHNAYVDMSNTDFTVVKEVAGDSIDTKKLKEAMLDTIAQNENEFVFVPSKYYEVPEITSDSQVIKDKLEYCKTYLTQEITLTTAKGEYTITPKQLDNVIKIENGKRQIRKNKVRELANYLKENFSTSGGTRKLHMAGIKKTITIEGGNYGATVDVDKEYEQLVKDLEAEKNVSRKLTYNIDWSGENGDVGNTYVEIDISKQHLWFVKDGKIKLSTNVVTGNVADGHATPTGVYSLAYKTSPAVLKGKNADGSDYESPVTYWMPFNGGIGCHDATWRSVFGGQIYRTGGSHGCVNMPHAAAGKLYGYVQAGMPVVVHP